MQMCKPYGIVHKIFNGNQRNAKAMRKRTRVRQCFHLCSVCLCPSCRCRRRFLHRCSKHIANFVFSQEFRRLRGCVCVCVCLEIVLHYNSTYRQFTLAILILAVGCQVFLFLFYLVYSLGHLHFFGVIFFFECVCSCRIHACGTAFSLIILPRVRARVCNQKSIFTDRQMLVGRLIVQFMHTQRIFRLRSIKYIIIYHAVKSIRNKYAEY